MRTKAALALAFTLAATAAHAQDNLEIHQWTLKGTGGTDNDARGIYLSVTCRNNNTVLDINAFNIRDDFYQQIHGDKPQGPIPYPSKDAVIYRFYQGEDGKFKPFFNAQSHQKLLDAMANGKSDLKRGDFPPDEDTRSVALAVCKPSTM